MLPMIDQPIINSDWCALAKTVKLAPLSVVGGAALASSACQ
jgi:hypothetical protein